VKAVRVDGPHAVDSHAVGPSVHDPRADDNPDSGDIAPAAESSLPMGAEARC